MHEKNVKVLRQELDTAIDALNKTTQRVAEANLDLVRAQEALTKLTEELVIANREMNRAKHDLMLEHEYIIDTLKADIASIRNVTSSLEKTVCQLELGTNETHECIETLITCRTKED
jgi:chromosome segregation ATPase